MSKWHISDDGISRKCTAQPGNCRYGGDFNHFETEADANAFSQARLAGQFGTLAGTDGRRKVDDGFDSVEESKGIADEINKRSGGIDSDVSDSKPDIRNEKQRLTDSLSAYWKDEKMVKHCLKSSKYLEIDGMFVDVADAKPTIHSKMYYDDETDGPETNYDGFYSYNERMSMPKKYEMTGRSYHGDGKLRFTPQYDGSQGYDLANLTYDAPEGTGIEVTEEQLEKINGAIQEVQEDFELRLQRYFKRYGDKITKSGYWANR